MKEFSFQIPEGYEIDLEKSELTNGYVAFRKKEINLPKTWDDVKNISGYFVGDTCNVESDKGQPNSTNKNVFCTYEQAKASLALAQLSQFRAIYRQGWKPDWNDDKSTKWCVIFHRNKVKVDIWYTTHHFLSFQSKEIAQEFLDHFGVLILSAKPLMS
jgi:hypothetical protein